MKRLKLSLLALVAVISATAFAINSTDIHADTVAAIQKQHKSGYLNADGQWLWFENGQRYTGFRHYMGTYYWFINGVRQDSGWRRAWGMTYYTDSEGRAVQGVQQINGKVYDFGNNGTFFSRGVVKDAYVNVPGVGWRWVSNSQMFSGFRHYMGTYYWFENGVRADNGWHFAWGFAYYTGKDGRALQGEQTIDGQTLNFGDDNTFYLRYFDGGSANPGDDPRRFMQPVTDLQFDYDENGHPIPGTAYWDN